MKVEEVKTIDPNNYVGEDVEIVKAVYQETKYGPSLLMVSSVIELKEGDSMPEDKPLTASKIFGLSKNKETEDIIIAKDGILHDFLKAKKIDPGKMPEYQKDAEVDLLLGIKCKVQKNKKNYLEIV